MAVYYHDTSALVKHYHEEIGTTVVDQIIAAPNSSHFLSRLCRRRASVSFSKKCQNGPHHSSGFS